VELDGTVATWGGMAGEGRRSSGCLQRWEAASGRELFVSVTFSRRATSKIPL
jgi:hypothetical protein